jgi:galactose mutarotase-like enzyme
MFSVKKNIFWLFLSFSFSTLTGCASMDAEKDAIVLKNKDMTVIFLPALGGKIISIKDSNGNEFLSRSTRPYKKRKFGMKYGDTEFDGIDECFPSMGGCAYPAAPYKGIQTGDHGEICQLPWTAVQAPVRGDLRRGDMDSKRGDAGNTFKSVTLQAKGINFPYVFTRKATLDGKTLILDYTVKNNGKAPLYHSYVFHPLFKGETGCFINIAPETEVKLLYSTKGFLGKMNSKVKLGAIKDKNGKPFFKNMFTKDIGRYYKFIVGKLKKGEAILRYKNGTGIKLSWSAEKMPYMAVWCSENGVKDLNHLAPEPAVSQFDTLEQAYKAGEAKVILAGGIEKWQIRLTLIGI